jgi:selenide, water dikinase
MSPGDLDRALCGLEFPADENVIVGLTNADDAGVYRVSDDLALIQTVDFFTPIVDDPYMFGQIAAANALSDVYAMGGVPKTALNLVAFPGGEMDFSILRQIIQGGIDKLREAGVVLLGGHTIEDKELKYGLSVTGFIHPDRVLTKRALQTGDRLILTKPLGIGIINTAVKAGLAPADVTDRVTRLMAALNKDAARIMNDFSVHACTDVTGFGLLGHLAEMVERSGHGVRLDASRVPLIPEAIAFAAMGLIPAGAYKNRSFREKMVLGGSDVKREILDLLYDPQTSGGLLICVEKEQAPGLVSALRAAGIDAAADIGEVSEGPEEAIRLE